MRTEKCGNIAVFGGAGFASALIAVGLVDDFQFYIHTGQPARLRLTALNARITPEVDAVVEEISADKLIDEATKQPYFTALLTISDPLPSAVAVRDLHPCMPVQAFITKEERSFFEYHLKPVFDPMQLASVEE
nr:HlyD family secretion protein [Rhizobium anhuiense]